MDTKLSIIRYVALVRRLRELEATKLATWKTLGYLPDGLYGTFSSVSRSDRQAIVACYRRGIALTGTCIAAAVLFVAAVAGAMLGMSIATPIAVVAVVAAAYAVAGSVLYFGPVSSLTQIKRVMYGFPSQASCARRAADEAAWRCRIRQRQAQN